MKKSDLINFPVRKDDKGYYIQRIGSKRMYVSDHILSDERGITVKDYLSNSREQEVTVTLKIKVNAPDADFATKMAYRKISGLPYEVTSTAQVSCK